MNCTTTYCCECGCMIVHHACCCADGPFLLLLPIPREWEQYFELDGSPKPIKVKYAKTNDDEKRNIPS